MILLLGAVGTGKTRLMKIYIMEKLARKVTVVTRAPREWEDMSGYVDAVIDKDTFFETEWAEKRIFVLDELALLNEFKWVKLFALEEAGQTILVSQIWNRHYYYEKANPDISAIESYIRETYLSAPAAFTAPIQVWLTNDVNTATLDGVKQFDAAVVYSEGSNKLLIEKKG